MNEMYPEASCKNCFDFHLEEFKLLKEEILQLQRIRFQVEIFTISAASVLVSFIISNNAIIERYKTDFIWWTPLSVLYFGFIWSRQYARRSFEIGEYLARVEARLGFSDLGWEHTLAPIRAARGGSISKPKRVIWVGLFLFFGLIAITFGAAPLWRLLPAP